MTEKTILTQSGICIREQIVTANACWTTVELGKTDPESLKFDAVKLTFDRAYPYIWVKSARPDYEIGIALTLSDVEKAAVLDDEGRLMGYRITGVDGIMPVHKAAFCAAVGARKSIYIIPAVISGDDALTDVPGGAYSSVCVAAQEAPVCPFAMLE